MYLIEPLAAAKLQPSGTNLSGSTNAAYFRSVMGQFDLEAQSALLVSGTQETALVPYDRLRTLAARSDLLHQHFRLARRSGAR